LAGNVVYLRPQPVPGLDLTFAFHVGRLHLQLASFSSGCSILC
jgi:hypothetical protein